MRSISNNPSPKATETLEGLKLNPILSSLSLVMASPTSTSSSTARSSSSTASSFSRNLAARSFSSSTSSSCSQGVKRGYSGSALVSSGIPDLDEILGGGFLLGSLVVVVEDPEAPHHLLLLRNFMAQGLVHQQPLLFASPSKDPRMFLGTLPSPVSSSSSSAGERRSSSPCPPGFDKGEQGLRIAWQYKKYFGEHQDAQYSDKGSVQGYCTNFDLRKPLDRKLLASHQVECVSLLDSNLDVVCDRCTKFLAQCTRVDENISFTGRIAIQSLGAPQCPYFGLDWDMLSFLGHLKATVRSCNAVAVVTFPASVLSTSMCKRWQHLADTLLSVRAIPDEDKQLAKLLTGYQDMVGFLHVHKVAQANTQVPVVLDTTTFSLKLHRRRSLVLERLNQAPVDGSTTSSSETSGTCSGSLAGTPFDF